MKNLLCKIKKISVLLMTFASAVFLCSCNAVKNEEPVVEEPQVEIEEAVIETADVEPEEIVEEEPEEEVVPSAKDLSPYKEIKLDGVNENHFIADDYCYIESEKYIIFLEDGVDVPGDLVVNIDAIINELEKQLDTTSAPSEYTYFDVTDMTVYFGFNPWEGWDIGTRIPIFIIADEEAEGLISCASSDFVVIADYAMYSEEVWNSNPEYYASDFRVRSDHVDYYTITHEMTHTITERHNEMTDIMTEGIADYMAREVMDALAPDYPSIAVCKENYYAYDNPIPEKVNAENAEAVFIRDYNEIDHANRGAEYTNGRYLCQFLDETYGDDFYSKYNDQINADGIEYEYNGYDEALWTKYADALKHAFGDDVFTKYGDWCVENNALQELGGVWPAIE